MKTCEITPRNLMHIYIYILIYIYIISFSLHVLHLHTCYVSFILSLCYPYKGFWVRSNVYVSVDDRSAPQKVEKAPSSPGGIPENCTPED